MPVKIKAAIEGLALETPPLPISTLHRQAQRLAQDLGEKAPSYKVVYNIVRALPADLLTLAHEGSKADYHSRSQGCHRCPLIYPELAVRRHDWT